MNAPSSVVSAVARMSPHTRPVRKTCTFLPVILPRTAPAPDILRALISAFILAVSPTRMFPLISSAPLKVPSKRTFALLWNVPSSTLFGPKTVSKPTAGCGSEGFVICTDSTGGAELVSTWRRFPKNDMQQLHLTTCGEFLIFTIQRVLSRFNHTNIGYIVDICTNPFTLYDLLGLH